VLGELPIFGNRRSSVGENGAGSHPGGTCIDGKYNRIVRRVRRHALRLVELLAWQLDHEPRTRRAVAAWQHPYAAAVQPHVFAYQGEPQTCALGSTAFARRCTAGEAFEDSLGVVGNYTVTMVFDTDPDVRSGIVGGCYGKLCSAATVQAGVVDQVGDDPGQPPSITVDAGSHTTRLDGRRCAGQTAGEYRLLDELADDQLVTIQPHGTGVVAGNFQ